MHARAVQCLHWFVLYANSMHIMGSRPGQHLPHLNLFTPSPVRPNTAVMVGSYLPPNKTRFFLSSTLSGGCENLCYEMGTRSHIWLWHRLLAADMSQLSARLMLMRLAAQSTDVNVLKIVEDHPCLLLQETFALDSQASQSSENHGLLLPAPAHHNCDC